MADDQGLVADIESDIVNTLSAITLSGNNVFRTVDHWKFQLQSADSFHAYSPFAFVEYGGTSRAGWQGDHDLHQTMLFNIRVGTELAKPHEGAARIGSGTDADSDAYQLGVSRLRDLVIESLQNQHPTTSDIHAEYYEYLGDDLVWSLPRQAALIMKFQVDTIQGF